ncbi:MULTISPECIES: ferritin [Parabacteroides]|uniref:ferritin n=1 Tax=Parabacteroides leei TaxID=2939491 RepID=UPI00189BBC23|nr:MULTISPECIES: ferritin [Parabacteroides]MCL3853959.1 ferritin [Parabacteroides leei]
MTLSRKLSDALNEQILAEMWSSNLYLSMSIHFAQLGMDGCAHWMKKQSQEELEHAYSMIDYSIKRGGQVKLDQINVVPTAFGTPLEIFEHVYQHEVHVSELIDKLVDVAAAEKDKATQDFLWGFVREQVEEEATAKNIVEKLKMYGEHHIAIMDHHLGKR